MRKNAIKFGVFTRDNLLDSGDRAELEELAREIQEAWKPVGPREEMVVDEIISITKQRLRLQRAQNGMFSPDFLRTERAPSRPSDHWDPIKLAVLGLNKKGRAKLRECFRSLPRKNLSETEEQQFREALAKLDTPQDQVVGYAIRLAADPENGPRSIRKSTLALSREAHAAETLRITRAFMDMADRWPTFMIYEGRFFRQQRSLEQQLERLQAARAGQYVPPPEAVDVNMNVNLNGNLPRDRKGSA